MKYQFELNELEFRLLRDFIHEKFGIYLKDGKMSFMQMKLYPRVISLGLSSFNEYFNFVRYGLGEKRELSRMISLLTNNETYFFRELPQLKAFRDELLPRLRNKKLACDKKEIKILSAGCSTGEEVYTLAMLLFETGNYFWGWDVQITGMDISTMALDTSRRGVYYQRSFRMTDPLYLKKFFSENSGNHYKVKDSIKRMTSFVHGNISTPEAFKALGEVDIIFCRNVLIYFSDEKFASSVNNFHNALNKGGHLFLGHSETLSDVPNKFETLRFPETLVYRKKQT